MSIKRPDRFAESLFANLCDREGVSCTRVHHDDKGWDFFIEFTSDESAVLPADKRPAPYKCLIQVKSVSKGAYRTKLSNELAFSKSELPCFVVAFIFDRDATDPMGVVIHHHWFDDIKASLLRARELHARGRDDVHRFHVTRRAPRSQMVPCIEAISTIKSVVAANPGYATKKLAYADSVGYEESSAVGSLTLLLESEDDFVDLHIGLKDSLEVTRFEMADQRFGIRARAATVIEGPGRVRVSVDPTPCILTIRPDNISAGVNLKSNLYTPAIPGLSLEQFKFRITSAFVELVVSRKSESCTFNVRWEGACRYTVSEMAELVAIFSIMESGEIDFTLKVDGARLFSASGPAATAEIPPYLGLVKRFSDKIAAADEQGASIEARYSLAEIYGKLEDIREFMGLSEDSGVTLSFRTTGLAEIPETGPLIYTHGIEFGDWLAMSLAKRTYRLATADDGLITLHLGPVEKSVMSLEPASNDVETRWSEELKRTERLIREREGVSPILIENLHMMGKEA